MWVLDSVYDLSREQITIAVDMLLNHQQLTLQDADLVSVALSQFRRHPKVEFSDCLALEIARKAGHIPLATFDRDFAKLADVERLN
jgi:predicted nucleic-acid-binding protein